MSIHPASGIDPTGRPRIRLEDVRALLVEGTFIHVKPGTLHVDSGPFIEDGIVLHPTGTRWLRFTRIQSGLDMGTAVVAMDKVAMYALREPQ
jgi:hypothetical protein